MHFSRPHVIGAEAADNGGFHQYENVYATFKALEAQPVNSAVILTITADATLGHTCTIVSATIDPLYLGVVDDVGVAGELVRLCVYGIHDVICDGSVTSGTSIVTSGTDGEVTDMAAGGENAEFGVALATDAGAATLVKAMIRAMG